jgi:K+-sensing histidine kinase KdpD
MRSENIKLSLLFEDVISEFVTRNPGVQANFEIENRIFVRGDYGLWRQAIQSLVENAIRFSTHADVPSMAIGRMENENVCVIMDDGFQFNIDAEGIILTVSLRQRPARGAVLVRRIVVMRGEEVWNVDEDNVGGIFHFSFN